MQNTSEMVDCGTHIRTSPFARAIYDTAATQVIVSAWNNVFSVQASAAEVGVYVDGVYQESLRPVANGPSTHIVTLPAGDKRVEIVTGGYRGPTNVAVPSVIGPAMWLRSLQFNAPATIVRSTERGVVILGDSIVNGSKLASAVQEAYPRILQMGVSFPVAVVGRGGLALVDITTTLGPETNFRPRKVAREIIKHNPKLVIFALGYNDADRGGWTSVSYRAAMDTLNAELKAFIPDVQVGAMSLLFTTAPPPNYVNIQNAAISPPSGIVRGIMGFPAPTLTAADLDADGIHPNAAGHIKIAAALQPYVAARYIDPISQFNFELIEDPSWMTTFSFGRQGDTLEYRDSGGGNRAGPKWYTLKDTQVPGDFYRYRATVEAGSAVTIAGSTFGTWTTNIQLNRGFIFNAGQSGRVRVDIAPTGSTTPIATYRIWRGPYAPPT